MHSEHTATLGKVVPRFQTYRQFACIVMQGTTRTGACAVYAIVQHTVSSKTAVKSFYPYSLKLFQNPWQAIAVRHGINAAALSSQEVVYLTIQTILKKMFIDGLKKTKNTQGTTEPQPCRAGSPHCRSHDVWPRRTAAHVKWNKCWKCDYGVNAVLL